MRYARGVNDRVTAVSFRLLTGRRREPRWIALGEEGASPAAMLDEYLTAPSATCCNFQGGFFVDVNGATWSDDSTVDEFRMTMIWFEAMVALLRGAASFGPGYGPWEESTLTWSRGGDTVTMADTGAGDRMWAVCVDLPSLALDVAVHGRAFAAWAREVRRLARAAPEGERRELALDEIPDERRLETIDRLVELVGVL